MSDVVERAKKALADYRAGRGAEVPAAGLIEWLMTDLVATQRLLDDLTDSDIGEVQARNQELWAQNQALLAEVRRLGGGVL